MVREEKRVHERGREGLVAVCQVTAWQERSCLHSSWQSSGEEEPGMMEEIWERGQVVSAVRQEDEEGGAALARRGSRRCGRGMTAMAGLTRELRDDNSLHSA